MLFTILIGVVTAGVYALRSAVIKLRFKLSGGRQEQSLEATEPFVVFTDDKRYWNVFEPLCDEFESRGLKVRYLTASPDDPALDKHYENITCEFVGEGNRAFATLNMLKADIVLSSTPGLDVYQWKRSRDVKWYAHILHAISDAAMYRMFGVDYYDAVLLTGEYQGVQIRELERLRNLPAKELPVVGLSYMDSMRARFEAMSSADTASEAAGDAAAGGADSTAAKDANTPVVENRQSSSETPTAAATPAATVVAAPSADSETASDTESVQIKGAPCATPNILLAPSWGASSIFSLYGGEIIGALLETGYHVVVRPHPQSMKSEREMMDKIMGEYPESDQIEWNFDTDNFNVLARSDLMISDFSGVIFDFALVFDRPIIYTEPSYDKAPYDACWLEDELWTFKVLPRIGRQLDPQHLGGMKELIDSCLNDSSLQQGRDEARDECWGCRGESAKVAVDYLVAKQAELASESARETNAPAEADEVADGTSEKADTVC